MSANSIPSQSLSRQQFRAVYSAAALIATQVGLGVILKTAQTGNRYAFSPSASVTISETVKTLVSAALFFREWTTRDIQRRTECYHMVATTPTSVPLVYDMGESLDSNDDGSSNSSAPPLERMQLARPSFWTALRCETSSGVTMGLSILALFYVLINNLVFVLYRMADPATIQLTKSGVTCITAFVMILALNTPISQTQWFAIVVQVCGLIVTQYEPTAGAAYPMGTYALLISHVFLSAISGVLNQALLQADNSSLYANNVILYGSGAATNLVCHMIVRGIRHDEPGFFEGYDGVQAIMIIVNNVLMGLVMNAVYKYADAVVKCLATAVATTIFIFLSPVLFGKAFSMLVVPGAILVFSASWLYAISPATRAGEGQFKISLLGRLGVSLSSMRKFYPILYIIGQLLTLGVVAVTSAPDIHLFGVPHSQTSDILSAVSSPFQNTLAFVRWNAAYPQRIETVMRYEPFFHTLHISMPDSEAPGNGINSTSLTHDDATISDTIYLQVAHTMRVILDSHSEITGLFYYHFDAWIDPLAWSHISLENIHFPFIKSHGPKTLCMTNVSVIDWNGWALGRHQRAKNASSAIKKRSSRYSINEKEWCLGWSDIYYIPRRFFQDFIYLSEVFADPEFDVYHEVAVPTMIHIIDNSLRDNPYIPIVNHISDCWGDCCASNPTVDDVLNHRCGHRLDYRDENVTAAFFDKLDKERTMLRDREAVPRSLQHGRQDYRATGLQAF